MDGPPLNPVDTRAARSRIFAALRSTVAAPLPAPDLSSFLRGELGAGGAAAEAVRGDQVTMPALLQQFESAARAWRADVVRAGVADWPLAVRAALDQRRCMCIAMGQESPLSAGLEAALGGLELLRMDQPLARFKHRLFDHVDAGVTSARAGVAETGSLVLWPGPAEPRSLSLVPPVHVAVLRASRLFPTLAQAWQSLAPQDRMPANLLLVSGPSKTADIQQTLAYGAHGPKELVIVLVDDLGEVPGEPAPDRAGPAGGAP